MRLLKILFSVVYLICNLHTSLNAQSSTLEGNTSTLITVFDDTLAGVTAAKVLRPYAGHTGWIRVGDYKIFALYFRFNSTGTTGIATTDTIEVLMEQYAGTERPTADSTGFLEAEAAGTVATRESIVTFNSTSIVNTPRQFVSYHGSGDPEIALAQYVRFYSRLVNGFTGSGLAVKIVLMRQP